MTFIKFTKQGNLLLLTGLLLVNSLSAQEKKDTKIVVQNDSANFNMILKILYWESYIVEQKDSVNGFIATKERAIQKDGSISIIIKLFIQNGFVTLTGEVASNVTINFTYAKTERSFQNIYYGGMKGSPLRNAWNEMDRIAHMMGRNVRYSK